MLNIYKIVETKSGAEVYANFWSETYYRYGSLLKNYSGGSYPGVMYLKKTKDGLSSNQDKIRKRWSISGEIDLEVM